MGVVLELDSQNCMIYLLKNVFCPRFFVKYEGLGCIYLGGVEVSILMNFVNFWIIGTVFTNLILVLLL